MTGKHQPPLDTVGDRLRVAILQLPADDVSLNDIMEMFGADSLMLMVCFLTLVFLVPVSIPGVSTLFGAVILLISITRLLGRDLWLPRSFAQRRVSADSLRAALNRALRVFARVERVCRPHRLSWLTSARGMGLINNTLLILGALLLMMPFGLIPFSNTLPALSLLLLALGLLQRDGVCILLGYAANLATWLYFGLLIGGGGAALLELWRHLF